LAINLERGTAGVIKLSEQLMQGAQGAEDDFRDYLDEFRTLETRCESYMLCN